MLNICRNKAGELSIVSLAMAGMDTKRIRIANLPPEVPKDTIRATLTPYFKIMDIQAEMWSKAYRYSVTSGIRQVTMMLTRRLPSHLMWPDTGSSCPMRGSRPPAMVVARLVIYSRGALHVKKSETTKPNAANVTSTSTDMLA